MYSVVFADRGSFPYIRKFHTRLDAVKFALERFRSGYDYICIYPPRA